MNTSTNSSVHGFLSDLSLTHPDKLELVETVRKIFLSSNTDLQEEIKYGGLCFNLTGSLVGGIFPYRNHVSIEFSNGARFPDDDHILEGKGKFRRHIKIIHEHDIIDKKVGVYITLAVTEEHLAIS